MVHMRWHTHCWILGFQGVYLEPWSGVVCHAHVAMTGTTRDLDREPVRWGTAPCAATPNGVPCDPCHENGKDMKLH